jgi:hypothetical protein
MVSDADEWFYELMYEAIEESDEDVEDIDISQATQDSIEDVAEDLYDDVKDDYSQVKEYRERIAGFEGRLHEHWGEAFDKLEQVIIRCFYLGAEINREERFEAAQEQDYVFEALTNLHARASQIAFEILTLIKSGYADAAFARWRSLHEVAIVTFFIKKHGQETAERFLLFENIETYYFAKNFMKHQEELGYDPISDEVLDELEERKEALVDRFGDVYDDEYGPGWALHVFANQSGGVRRLEKEVGLQHYRPFYRLASKSVHGTPKGTLDRLGMQELPDDLEQPQVLAAGPTNLGFSDPAVMTAISLTQVTAALTVVKPAVHRVVEGQVNHELVQDLKEIFAEKTQELIEKEREVQEERSNMEVPTIARLYVGFTNLLNDEFVEEYTSFVSVTDFFEAVPLDIDTLDDLNDEDSDEFEAFIAGNSDFESADDLAEKAFEIWVQTETDVSEFLDDGSKSS